MAAETLKGDPFGLLFDGKPVCCRYHKQETYQRYCKDCHDFVCFECLGETHHKHSLCRLREAKKEMCEDIRTLLSTENRINERLDLIKEKLAETSIRLAKSENELKVRIESTAKDMIEYIQMSTAQLLSSVKEIFNEYTKEIREAQHQAERMLSLTAYFDTESLKELDFLNVVKVLADLKECFEGDDKKIANYEMPLFKPNLLYPVGNICKATEVEEDCDVCQCVGNKQSVQKVSICKTINVFTQTDQDVQGDSDSESEWFDADDLLLGCSIENSSDKIQDVYPLHIKLENDIKLVRKIIPVSDNDAWILADRKLRKIVDRTLDVTVYAENVDDITVIKNGNVLVLNKTNDFIMRLLPDKRLVRFCNAKSGSTIPCCLGVAKDDSVIVNLYFDYLSFSSVIVLLRLNHTGVEIGRHQVTCTAERKSPYFVLSNEPNSNLCALYRNHSDDVSVLKILKTTGEEIATFNGAFGLTPSRHFKCHGICTDNKGNVLVSDYLHHSVYTLDKHCKFQSCIVDASDGLNNPASIALYENRLWVADGQQILIFRYDNNKCLKKGNDYPISSNRK